MKGGDREQETRRVVAPVSNGERRFGLRPAGEAALRVAAPIVALGGGGVLVRLKAEWSAVAGAELAAQTWPEKLGRDGALKFRVDSRVRPRPAAPRIAGHRSNQFFFRARRGDAARSRTGTLPLAEFGTADSQSRPPASPPTGHTDGLLDSRLAEIDDPELRAALAGLGD